MRAVERHGAWIPIWPVGAAALPAWLGSRARALNVEMEPAAAQLIVDRVEGNLLAAKQELEKLALLADGEPISTQLVMGTVADSARYDIFQLAEAAAAGDAQRALRVLLGLKSEGVEPTLILWALVRELRGLWQARERDRLHTQSAGAGWNQAARPSRACARADRQACRWRSCCGQASRRGPHLKGVARGDAWTAIIGLTGSAWRALCKRPGNQAG